MADNAEKKRVENPEFRGLTDKKIDISVGRQLRKRRLELCLSQTEIANGIDVTFQQVQKYERGFNRISASRLYDLAELLNVKIEYFFDSLAAGTSNDIRASITISEVLKLSAAVEGLSDTVRLRLRSLLAAVARS